MQYYSKRLWWDWFSRKNILACNERCKE